MINKLFEFESSSVHSLFHFGYFQTNHPVISFITAIIIKSTSTTTF